MSLPHELTTFPRNALDILRYLNGLANHAAFDGDIIDALDLSERGFGKAIRRLVTKEYVEMQIDGTYALTRRGQRGAEAIAAHDAETGAAEDTPAPVEATEHTFIRRLIVVHPKTIPAGKVAYLFARMDAPASGEPENIETSGALETALRLRSDCLVNPAQLDLTVPSDEMSPAVRFEVTAPASGHFPVTIEAFQVSDVDLINAGEFETTLTAITGATGDAFQVQYFDLVFQRAEM